MKATVADAWSLAPIGELRLGEKVFPVPPLTFGRFQRLLAAETRGLMSALAGFKPRLRATERVMERALRWTVLYAPRLTRYIWRIVERFGLGRQNGRVPEATPLVSIVVPGVTEADWRTHGSPVDVARLFLMFGKGHDWAAISDAIRFGEPPEPGETMPSMTDIIGGLVAVGKATGYTIEALTEMRVDGFYLLVDALREQREPQPGGELPMGIEYADQTDGSKLLELLSKAEEARRGE